MYQSDKELTVTEIAHPCLPMWRHRIDDAEERGAFDYTDWQLSNTWDQCAVGEARTMLGDGVVTTRNYYDGAWDQVGPADLQLRNLGIEFWYTVRDNRGFDKARSIIDKIEARLAELVQQ